MHSSHNCMDRTALELRVELHSCMLDERQEL